ncbi:M48 family metallopeptidase [Anaerobacillus sp. 1_MG-2023]|uniref:M48 family metallopeptidase n=1 Tax=Anaerobacillus sp. 1_MG-2023 TaxID=3062655 RepID=UPI0026E4657B|nr:SprT family zinc-dependent metalloprotease [Anaerobacillus sp. 1_MG-2023]MDO6657367.1 SprT family zinc-dependent metalloprotease [Anaerobacillus sp. 1_MG-2023]
MNSIQFGNKNIYYTLKESHNRKTFSISVNQYGVNVVSPPNVPIDKIEDILFKKGPWIVKQLSDFQEMQESVKLRSFVSGEKLPYLGRQYRLKIMKTDQPTPALRFHKGRFYGEVHHSCREEEYRALLRPLYIEWVKRKGDKFTKDRLEPFTLKLQKEPKNVVIKDQEQRWGSCTPEGKLLLNWRIFLAPASIVDYVITHELAHLVHLNHSKEYWDTVRMLLPDYEDRKEWLRLKGATLEV